jgi:hypothetical protein
MKKAAQSAASHQSHTFRRIDGTMLSNAPGFSAEVGDFGDSVTEIPLDQRARKDLGATMRASGSIPSFFGSPLSLKIPAWSAIVGHSRPYYFLTNGHSLSAKGK